MLLGVPFGPRLVGNRIVLRPPLWGDVEARQRLGRHAEIAKSFGAKQPISGPVSFEAAAAWVEGLGGPGTIEWVIEAEGSFVGSARLHSFQGQSARYAIGILDPHQLGRGFGTEATRLVIEYGFASLDLDRIELAVLEFNDRAIRCYTRCGFREFQRLPDAANVDDQSLTTS